MTYSFENIFIDEFGDTSLETQKEVVSNYFILVATIVSGEDITDVRSRVEILKKKHFQQGEIKSSKVGKKDNRRIKILHDISELDVKFYIVAIDKTSLRKTSGLIYKKSFFKFMNGILYQTIFEVFPNAQVRADEHGYPEYMESLKKYVLNRTVPNLFDKITFESFKSEKEPLIQISDFIAGTIARVIDKTKSSENSNEFLKLLKNQIIRIDEWPMKPRPYSGKIGLEHGTKFDERIRELSFNQASIFVDKNSDSEDEQVIDQVNVLQYLLYYFKFVNPNGYVYGEQLLQHCKYGKKKHYLHSSVIAKLRDNGVIISSCNKGYKIPANSDDLLDYVEQAHSKILPMLLRLDKANKKIKLATKKELDLLEHDRYQYLGQAIESFTQNGS